MIGSFLDIFLISIGSVVGVLMRYHITEYVELISGSKLSGTLVVNLIASFALGFLVTISDSLFLKFDHISIMLLLSVGFLASLSTFSGFILQFINSLINRKWRDFIILCPLSLLGGFVAVFVGISMGNL